MAEVLEETRTPADRLDTLDKLIECQEQWGKKHFDYIRATMLLVDQGMISETAAVLRIKHELERG